MFSLFLVTFTKISHFSGTRKKFWRVYTRTKRNELGTPIFPSRTWESAAEVVRRASQTNETHYNETNTKSREAKKGKKPAKNRLLDYGSCESDARAATARACCDGVIMNENAASISSCVWPTGRTAAHAAESPTSSRPGRTGRYALPRTSQSTYRSSTWNVRTETSLPVHIDICWRRDEAGLAE